MKLSTKGRYGARAMLDLALHYGQGPVSIKDIAEREEISERYLVHLMVSLKSAGLVKSIRGAHGGFTLARPPAEIKLGEIVHVVEGSIAPVECAEDPKICSRSSYCVTRDIWIEMNEAMGKVLDSATLEDMVQRQADKNKHRAEMYYI